MKILTNILYSLFFILLIGGAALFVLPSMPFLGHLDVKIVKSGSMEPGIMTGGIVVIHPAPAYSEGDVITFKSTGADIPTTHRIVGTEMVNGELHFMTKGDANEERDTELILPSAIRGKVLFTLPYVGFILDFARQPIGFALLIGLPALLIVIDEIEKIWREIRKRKQPVVPPVRTEVTTVVAPLIVAPYVPPRVRMMDIRPVSRPVAQKHRAPSRPVVHRGYHDVRRPGWVMATSLSLMFVVLMGSAFSVGDTASYFNDTESTLGNTMEADALGFSVSPSTETIVFNDSSLDTPESTLTTTVTLEAGSVPLMYQLTVGSATGTIALCDAVTVSSPHIAYSGTLTALFENVVSLGSTWDLVFNLGSGAYAPGDVCTIDLIHGAWNATLPTPSGYDDEERVRLTFTAPAAPIAPLMAPASFMMEGVDMGTSDIVPPEGDVPPPTPAGEEIVPPSEEVPLPEEPVTPDVPAGEVIEEPAPAAPVPAPSPAEEVVV